jgi:hypothetical protein
MKQFSHIILALILCSLIWSCRSNHAFSSFYKENKDDIQVHINAPKWLTLLFVPSDEKAEIKRFSKGIRKVKLMMSENDNANDLSKSFEHFTSQNGYTPYVYINDENEHINLMAKHKGDYITELVLKYDSYDETVLLGLLGKMHKSTFNEALKRATDSD